MTKFEKENQIIDEIIERGEYTISDHIKALKILQTPFHDSGKIEGIQSCDGTCTNCHFCQSMRKAAENNSSIICGKCYDWKQQHSYRGTNILNRHTLQLKILTHFDFTVEELKSLSVYSVFFRFNSSGDIELSQFGGLTQAKNYIKIVQAFPYTRFSLWSKNIPVIEAAFDELGKPENLRFIQSSAIIDKPCKRSRYADLTFTVYADRDAVAAAVALGAGECNGKKCKDCGYKCYDRVNGWSDGQDIAELLKI